MGGMLVKIKRLSLVREAKITNTAVSALFCLAAIAYIIWHREENTEVLKWVICVTCILVAGAKMFGYFSNDAYRLAFQFDFAVGVLTAIVGIAALVLTDVIIANFPIVVGAYSLLDGLLKIQIAMDAKKFGFSRWFILLMTGILLALLSIGALVWQYYSGGGASPYYVGVLMLLTALESGYVTIYTVRVRAKKKNVEDRFDFDKNE